MKELGACWDERRRSSAAVLEVSVLTPHPKRIAAVAADLLLPPVVATNSIVVGTNVLVMDLLPYDPAAK